MVSLDLSRHRVIWPGKSLTAKLANMSNEKGPKGNIRKQNATQRPSPTLTNPPQVRHFVGFLVFRSGVGCDVQLFFLFFCEETPHVRIYFKSMDYFVSSIDSAILAFSLFSLHVLWFCLFVFCFPAVGRFFGFMDLVRISLFCFIFVFIIFLILLRNKTIFTEHIEQPFIFKLLTYILRKLKGQTFI